MLCNKLYTGYAHTSIEIFNKYIHTIIYTMLCGTFKRLCCLIYWFLKQLYNMSYSILYNTLKAIYHLCCITRFLFMYNVLYMMVYILLTYVSINIAQDSIQNMLFCFYVIFLLRDEWMIERLSEAMGAALVGNNFSPIPWKFHFRWKKKWLVAARNLQSIKPCWLLNSVLQEW